MRQATYVDAGGRHHAVRLPDGYPDTEAHMGLPIGPPDLSALGLPPEVETRLHNELFHRGILTYANAVARRGEIVAALMAALRVDAGAILALYAPPVNGHKPTSKTPEQKTRRAR